MNKKRILSYQMSKKISEEELKDIAAAGRTSLISLASTNPHRGVCVDVNVDY